MIVDFHTHIFKSELIKDRDIFRDDNNFSFLYSNEKAKMIDHNIMLESMKNSDIDYVVAMGIPWEKEKPCDEHNLYFREVLDISEGKIIPFGSVPMDNNANMDKWVKRIKDIGLAGIGEVAFYAEGMNKKNNDFLRRLLSSAKEYSLPVCLHVNEPVGHNYPGKYDSNLKTLYSIIQEFRDLTIILAHWGGGLLFYELMPEVKEDFENIYYDTAASPYLYKDRIFDIAIDIVGSDKILFGTDFPLISFNRYLKAVDENVENIDDRNKILGENAMRILNINKKKAV